MSIAALVISIIALLTAFAVWVPCLGWVSWFAWVIPVLSFILGLVGRGNDMKMGQPTGMAMAAVIMSIIAFLMLAVRGFISIFTLGI